MTASVELRAILREEITPALTKIEDRINRVGSTSASAGRIMGGAFMPVIRSSRELTDELERNVAQLTKQRDAMRTADWQRFAGQQKALKAEIASMTGETQSLGSSWTELAGKFYLASAAVQPLVSVMGSLVDAAKQYDSIRSRLNAAEGSSLLGGEDFRQIQEMAKKPGLGFEQAASAMATLRGMKVTAAEAKQLIMGVAQANASAAGTAEQFGHVMYQIQQSVSLGRLMAEDLRPIMQQIPTLGAAIQEHFGASQAEELNKRLKESGKSVREFWLEVAQLGEKLPAAGETIANNLDNMGDAWIRLKASLTDTEFVKKATKSLGDFMEKIAIHNELETKAVEIAQKARGRKGNTWRDVLWGQTEAEWIQANLRKGGKSGGEIQADVIAFYTAEDDRVAAVVRARKAQLDKEAEADRPKGGDTKKAVRDPSARWATRTGRNEVTLTDSWDIMGDSAAEHARNVERAEAADKRKGEERLRERERLLRELERKDKEIAAQEGRVEKARKHVADAIQKDQDRRQEERLDKERRFWESMKQTTTDGLAGILIAEQEGASWWSGIDGMRHRLVKAGITGATRMGVDWLAGMAGMVAGGPVGGALGMGGMEMLSSFLGFRANGGHTLNAQVVGERGAEVYKPTVPGTIYNNSQSTSYHGGITVILPNVRNASDMARELPRATRSATANRRQTSL